MCKKNRATDQDSNGNYKFSRCKKGFSRLWNPLLDPYGTNLDTWEIRNKHIANKMFDLPVFLSQKRLMPYGLAPAEMNSVYNSITQTNMPMTAHDAFNSGDVP